MSRVISMRRARPPPPPAASSDGAGNDGPDNVPVNKRVGPDLLLSKKYIVWCMNILTSTAKLANHWLRDD
eukprot:scaffold36144_cov32-Attheya_sp.AAC.1